MAHKKRHGPAPVPPGNLPQSGPPAAEATPGDQAHAGGGAPLQKHDAKRRIGDFESAGEHARQQPSQINDGQQHSK
jgi:hypothetical protein